MFLIIVEVLSISLSSSLVGLYSSMHSSDVLLSTSVVLVSLSFPFSSYSAILSFNELKALSTTLSHFNSFLISIFFVIRGYITVRLFTLPLFTFHYSMTLYEISTNEHYETYK